MGVRVPLRTLVPQEEIEHVLTEGVGHEFAALHRLDRPIEARRQRLQSHSPPFRRRQCPDIVFSARRQIQAVFDALESGGQQQCQGQVGITCAVQRSVFNASRIPLVRLVHGDPNQSGPVVVTPTDERRRLVTCDQTFVGIDPLVGDGGDFRGVPQQSGHE